MKHLKAKDFASCTIKISGRLACMYIHQQADWIISIFLLYSESFGQPDGGLDDQDYKVLFFCKCFIMATSYIASSNTLVQSYT